MNKDFSPINQIQIVFIEKMVNMIHTQNNPQSLKNQNQSNQIYSRKGLQNLRGWIKRINICLFKKEIILIC